MGSMQNWSTTCWPGVFGGICALGPANSGALSLKPWCQHGCIHWLRSMDQFYDWRGMNALYHGLDFFGKRTIGAHDPAQGERVCSLIPGVMDFIVMIALFLV